MSDYAEPAIRRMQRLDPLALGNHIADLEDRLSSTTTEVERLRGENEELREVLRPMVRLAEAITDAMGPGSRGFSTTVLFGLAAKALPAARRALSPSTDPTVGSSGLRFTH